MEINTLCLGCMTEKGEVQVCPSCGYSEGSVPDSPQCLQPGNILNGQYLVGRALGRGGFGITYLAWDLNLNIKLAIKEYLPEAFATRSPGNDNVTAFSGDAGKQYSYGLEKFLDEAKAVAQFNGHQNIVAVRNFFRENGTAYFVMDYIEGRTFKKYIEEKGGRVPFEEALKIMVQVMDALKEVHEKGLLHRDISPDNVYLTKNGQVKVLDFGAARNAVGENNKSISVILKPGYAAEEQYRSKGKQGAWTDVYATAATIYRAIVGQVPPESLDRMERDDLQFPSRLGISIPQHAESAIIKALAIRASDRFQSMGDFQNAINGKPIANASGQDMIFVNCPSCGTSNKVSKSRWEDFNAKVFCKKCGNPMKANSVSSPAVNSYMPSQLNVPPPAPIQQAPINLQSQNSYNLGTAPFQQVPISIQGQNSYNPGQVNMPPPLQYQQPSMNYPPVNSYRSVQPNMPPVNSYQPHSINAPNPNSYMPNIQNAPISIPFQQQQMGGNLANPYQQGYPNLQNVRFAGFWRRFLAMILDGLIFAIPTSLIFSNKSFEASGGKAFLINLILGLVVWSIFAAFESSKLMGTPGKKAMGICVTDLSGNKVSFGKAFGRNVGKLLSYVIILIGFLMAGFTSKKQALHDIMSGCLVTKRSR